MTNAEFEGIVEEAWERHMDSADRSDTRFWFWVAQIAWERGYTAASVALGQRVSQSFQERQEISRPALQAAGREDRPQPPAEGRSRGRNIF